MQAVILAAGSARRMLPLSSARHKAMLEIGGTTILARIVDELTAIGVRDIVVVTGYRAAEVRHYLSTSCAGPAYRFVDNPAFATTNNIVSLSLALDHTLEQQDVLLVECDLLLAPGILGRLAGPDRGNAALLDRYRPGMDGTVVTVQDGVVSQVLPPDAQGEDFEYRGTFKTLNVYRFSSGYCRDTLAPLLRDHVEEVDATAYYEVVLARLGDISAHRIEAEILDGEPWAEVDDPNDVAAAQFLFEPDRRAEILDRTRGGQWGLELLDFAFMRNVHFPPPAMVAALRHALGPLLSGYGSTQAVCDEKLAWFLGCDPARLLALGGAAQAFPILRSLWASSRVAIPQPTFGEYPQAFPGARTYVDGPGVDPDELERLAGEVDVLVVVNPNNPTGTTLRSDALHALAARHPRTRLLVDESFLAFSDQPSLVDLLEDAPLPNVVVLCSLSKTLGVPGLRIGYAYAPDVALRAAMAEGLPIWNMSAPAEHFVELLLKFRPALADSLDRTRADRAALADALRGLPAVAEVHPSGGNFLLVRLHGDAGTAAATRRALLAREAIEIKDISAKFPDGQPRLRLAVRGPADNARLVAALAAVTSPPVTAASAEPPA